MKRVFLFYFLSLLAFACTPIREKNADPTIANPGGPNKAGVENNYRDTIAFGSSFIFINPYFEGEDLRGTDINDVEKEVVGFREAFKSSLPQDRVNVVIGKQPVVRFPNGAIFDMRYYKKRVAVGIKEANQIQGFDSWKDANGITEFIKGMFMSIDNKQKPDTTMYEVKKDYNLKSK